MLFGRLSSGSQTSGLATFHGRIVEGLARQVDLHLLIGDPGDPAEPGRPTLRWGTQGELPALFAQPPAFRRMSTPREDPEVAAFAAEFAAKIREKDLDTILLVDDEAIGYVTLQAAARAGVPWIVVAVDNRMACAQNWLLEAGERLCQGPDPTFSNCARCIATERSRDPDPRMARIRDIGKRLFYALGLKGPRTLPPAAWKERADGIAELLKGCHKVVTFTAFHRNELVRLTGLPAERFAIVPYGVEGPPPGYAPAPDRFERPLRFGWIHRPVRGWGLYFLLEVWRRAGIAPGDAQLWFYVTGGTESRLRREGYGDLLDRKAVVIREERVQGREADVLSGLAAFVEAPLWRENGFSPECWAYRVPLVLPDGGAAAEPLQHGVTGFVYPRGDQEALVALVRRLVANPDDLRSVAERDLFCPDEHGSARMCERYLEILRTAAASRPAKAG